MARILVADDDTLIRRFIQQALEFGGHHAVLASDGAEAIALIDSDRGIDAVVTDHAMPRASGLEVIAHAQRVDPTLPCIIVTAFRDLDLAMRGMQEGAVGYIPKPFKPDHLLTVISRALERRELAAEAHRLRLLAPMLERFTVILSSTLETKDLSTRQHSERLLVLSDRIAAHLGLAGDERQAVRLGAALHDIGKVGIPEELLRKPAALSDEEYKVMRRHPEIGAAILESVDDWLNVRRIVRHHHERFDGTGYPDRLAGAAIPQGARIVGVADAFDVMISGRTYSAARPFEQVLDEMRRERGRQFDPQALDAFLDLAESGAVGPGPLPGMEAAETPSAAAGAQPAR